VLGWKQSQQALPDKAGGAVVMTTVDQTLMRGSKPHDRWCVAELPRSRNLRRIGDPADSACEGSPDRGLVRQQRVGWVAGASLGCGSHALSDQLAAGDQRGCWLS